MERRHCRMRLAGINQEFINMRQDDAARVDYIVNPVSHHKQFIAPLGVSSQILFITDSSMMLAKVDDFR